MNQILEETIVAYVLHQLGVGSVGKNSLTNNNFILDAKLDIFDGESGMLYGITTDLLKINVNIFCAEFPSNDGGLYITIIKLTDLPTYALYSDKESDYNKLLVKTDNNDWMKTNAFLQASFLGGMEHINMAHPTYIAAKFDDFNKQDLVDLIRFIDARED